MEGKDFLLFNMCKGRKRKSVSHLLWLTMTLCIRLERNNVFLTPKLTNSTSAVDRIKHISKSCFRCSVVIKNFILVFFFFTIFELVVESTCLSSKYLILNTTDNEFQISFLRTLIKYLLKRRKMRRLCVWCTCQTKEDVF